MLCSSISQRFAIRSGSTSFSNDPKEGFRKLKERVAKVIKRVEQNIETGNQSGKEGDLSKLFSYVQQIIEEREAKKEEKIGKRKFQDTLNGIGKEILAGKGPLKVKLLNNEIVDNTKSDRKPKDSWETLLVKALAEPATGTTTTNKQSNYEAQELFELRFTKWVDDTKKDVFDLMDVAQVGHTHYELLNEIGLSTLINIHCTRESEAPAADFKREVKEFGLDALVCSKLYVGLQKWRREVEALMKQERDQQCPAYASSDASSSSSTAGTPRPSVPSSVGSAIALASRGSSVDSFNDIT